MNLVFTDFNNEFVRIYLDDILVNIETYQKHLDYLKKVFELISGLNYIKKSRNMNPKKHQINYLG